MQASTMIAPTTATLTRVISVPELVPVLVVDEGDSADSDVVVADSTSTANSPKLPALAEEAAFGEALGQGVDVSQRGRTRSLSVGRGRLRPPCEGRWHGGRLA